MAKRAARHAGLTDGVTRARGRSLPAGAFGKTFHGSSTNIFLPAEVPVVRRTPPIRR